MSVHEVRIETERLVLRLPRIGDFDRFAELLADEDAARHIGGHAPRAAAWRRFLQQPGAWMLQGFGMFSVIDRDTGLWLGQAGPWKPEGWPGNEIGYSFHPDAWGRGYASEATVAAVDWALANLGWDDFIHCIAPANLASQALARRLGSRLRGPGQLPAPYEDAPVEVWEQTRAQWQDTRKRFA
ncbi:GNAT family N-acetyltransferase [Luteimonas sp. MC1750]|uniref:GNAT family N-acetyltransferase n=1 Tax=Luteimonas sp. MC1750 TaxID=2799326 RepID=UPI0018F08C8D|nr:GNAT family N-acetyltransferase [Luteimonas sp. MC1750]MBJ6984258.1 GNAT family N-acetyltransferase [Luteimonas sp. MC1750]MBJ6985671.1 GNAT family N-acetyltransferase [Luteimonas sp. MC1750]QQO06958.1 GNAT family N-acetyltransferase [Luteimonas sp. MC1750]